MPFYQNIKPQTPEGKRTIEHLLVLRGKLSEQIPEKELMTNLLLATWNIREFGTSKYGGRRDEAYYYIAEIISRFDIIAIQEVREDLSALKKLLTILGGYWDYIFTDVTEGKQGNGERLAFLFDTRKVRFGGLAGEMVLPPFEKKDPDTGQVIYEPVKQLVRTPFQCGFLAGWTNFILSTVHILYGSNAANDPDRIKEIESVAGTMAKKETNPYSWSNNVVLLGDFNIYSPKDETYQAIEAAGFMVPKAIQDLPGSNVPKNKFYDQIAFRAKPHQFESTGRAGIFDYYQYVFTLAEEEVYADEMGKAYHTNSKGEEKSAAEKTTYYKTYWRTFQMSDHLPMWVEIKIDHTDAYLTGRLGKATSGQFVITKNNNGKYQFNLKAANGVIILTGDEYSSKAGCLNGIESVRKNASDDDRYVKGISADNQYFFHLKASNGQVIGSGSSYSSEQARDEGIGYVKSNAPFTIIITENQTAGVK
jgi:uncharacterized protein YegP (UPF0339 family)/endonuclease/exonuclease/phosphatase family metal-dependent hydrolase